MRSKSIKELKAAMKRAVIADTNAPKVDAVSAPAKPKPSFPVAAPASEKTGSSSSSERNIEADLKAVKALTRAGAKNAYAQTAEILYFDAKEAARWREEFFYEKQRPLRDGHIIELAEIMQEGDFAPTSIMLAVCREWEKSLLVDGQHRLAAVELSECPIALCVHSVYVETMEDVARLYYRIDRPATRTLRDATTVLELPERLGMAGHHVSALAAAARFIHMGFRSAGGQYSAERQGSRLRIWSRDDQINAVYHWSDEMLALIECLKGASVGRQKMLMRASVLSIALVTMRHAPDQARAFWGNVATGENLTRNAPEAKLADKLLTTPANATNNPWLARACASCWNAFYESRELSKVYADTNRPVVLLGTPYNGDMGPMAAAASGSSNDTAEGKN
jgi:hypothetical protein